MTDNLRVAIQRVADFPEEDRLAIEQIDREAAIDILSGALAAADCVTGVHVCGDGDLSLALEAGPQIVGVEVREELVRGDAQREPVGHGAVPVLGRVQRKSRGNNDCDHEGQAPAPGQTARYGGNLGQSARIIRGQAAIIATR